MFELLLALFMAFSCPTHSHPGTGHHGTTVTQSTDGDTGGDGGGDSGGDGEHFPPPPPPPHS